MIFVRLGASMLKLLFGMLVFLVTSCMQDSTVDRHAVQSQKDNHRTYTKNDCVGGSCESSQSWDVGKSLGLSFGTQITQLVGGQLIISSRVKNEGDKLKNFDLVVDDVGPESNFNKSFPAFIQIPGYRVENVEALVPTSDGGFLAVLTAKNTETIIKRIEIIVMKLSKSADYLWHLVINTPPNPKVTAPILLNSENDIFIALEFSSKKKGAALPAIVKINRDGKLVWQEEINPNKGRNSIKQILLIGDSLLVCGSTQRLDRSTADIDVFFLRMDMSSSAAALNAEYLTFRGSKIHSEELLSAAAHQNEIYFAFESRNPYAATRENRLAILGREENSIVLKRLLTLDSSFQSLHSSHMLKMLSDSRLAISGEWTDISSKKTNFLVLIYDLSTQNPSHVFRQVLASNEEFAKVIYDGGDIYALLESVDFEKSSYEAKLRRIKY